MRGAAWTTEEDAILRQFYPRAKHAELYQLLPGRTRGAWKNRARYLDIPRVLRETAIPFGDTILAGFSEAEKGYLAGIIDGEGCICLLRRRYKDGYYYWMVVSVSNTRRELLHWLNVRIRGCVHGRKEERGQRKSCHCWDMTGKDRVPLFLAEIAPYLVIKRRQAELLQGGIASLCEEERDRLYQELRVLNKRGTA